MIENFQPEEKSAAPAEARYLVNTWDGVDWYVCWRPASDTSWVCFAVEKTPQAAFDRMYKHVQAQTEKPAYFGKEGHLISG